MRAIRRTFGPRFSERKLRAMNMRADPEFAGHGSCWVNDWDCGDGCVMAELDGEPETVELREETIDGVE